ncbi:MAG: COX15/CtaA family protein, partial [Gemmatirosa sp.]
MTLTPLKDAVAVRRAAVVALAVAFVHVVFGAIVRISGSGMGCLDKWPRCADPRTGQQDWFPPMDQPQLVIEWTHRLLASVLIVAIAAVVALAIVVVTMGAF